METSAFDDARSAALDVTYSQFGVLATYIVNGGSPVAVTLLVDDRSRDTRDKSGSRSKVHTLRGSVRVSEVTELGRGDTLLLDEETAVFKITPNSVSRDGLEWSFEATADVVTTVGDVQTFPQQ